MSVKNDYELFLAQDNEKMPADVAQSIQQNIEQLLNPHPFKVFAKVLSIHSIVGTLSLAICHQFDMNPFQTSRSLSDWVMNLWGHSACMVFCGLLFVSLSVFFAGAMMSLEEIKILRTNKSLQIIGLGLVSLTIFALAGAEIALSIALYWLAGALVGGISATEALWFAKRPAYV